MGSGAMPAPLRCLQANWRFSLFLRKAVHISFALIKRQLINSLYLPKTKYLQSESPGEELRTRSSFISSVYFCNRRGLGPRAQDNLPKVIRKDRFARVSIIHFANSDKAT
jgi:hypothetical protein